MNPNLARNRRSAAAQVFAGAWVLAAALGATAALAAAARAADAPAASAMARYDHIFIIVAENHGFKQLIGNPLAPNLNRLAQGYGLATQFYGEVHPSEANYVAMVGGDTFGIHDDDAFYCKPGATDRHCERVGRTDYVDHTVASESLVDQLAAHQLTWKGYFEDIPEPGSKVVFYPSAERPVAGQPYGLYAAKHNAFINFKSVQDDPDLARKFVGFDQLARDLAAGAMPNYAQIVPNQCNEMHGRDPSEDGEQIPEDCLKANSDGRIKRGDAVIGKLVGDIIGSTVWSAAGNAAIVITFDEDNKDASETVQGCCGTAPGSAAQFGGGHIPTIVIANHGPRGVQDATPYNHYSLLRTTQAAFGLQPFLNFAAREDLGVKTMVPLFAVPQ